MQHSIHIPNEKTVKLKPVVAGFEDCEKGHFFGPAVRQYWLFHYVVSGSGVFEIYGNKYTLGSGNIFIIPPFVETFYKADEENPWSYIWIGFEADEPLALDLPNTVYSPRAADIFYSIKKSEILKTARIAFLTGKLWELFALLSEDSTDSVDIAEAARDIIHSEYIYGITVSDIAKRLNVNRSYLSVIFKEKFGISPKGYLMGHQMSIAASLLQKGNGVKVTANSVGYSDMFTFSKIFKSHYGISPSEYQKKHR